MRYSNSNFFVLLSSSAAAAVVVPNQSFASDVTLYVLHNPFKRTSNARRHIEPLDSINNCFTAHSERPEMRSNRIY